MLRYQKLIVVFILLLGSTIAKKSFPQQFVDSAVQGPLHEIQNTVKNLHRFTKYALQSFGLDEEFSIFEEQTLEDSPHQYYAKTEKDVDIIDKNPVISRLSERNLDLRTKSVHNLQRRSSLTQISNDTKIDSCSGFGLLDYEMVSRNTCIGVLCIVTKVENNGTYYDHADIDDPQLASSPFTNVVEMLCIDNDILVQFNMEETHQATQCKIEKLYCNGKERNPKDVSNTALFSSCLIGTHCLSNYKRYGYDFFGFYCEQEELICNGTSVPPQNLNTTMDIENCTVQTRPCTFNEARWGNCYQISKFCPGDIVNNCSFNQHQVNCNSSNNQCILNEFTCNGTSYDIDNYNGTLDGCTIDNLSCDGDIVTTDSFGNDCKVGLMICNDQIVNPLTFNGNLSTCVIERLSCTNVGDPNTNCSIVELTCDSPRCELSYQESLCSNEQTCQQPVNTSSCICPTDRVGSDCSKPRSINCTAPLVSPRLYCQNPLYQDTKDPKANLLDGDPACLVFALDETASLRYNITCEFTEKPEISQKVIDANFNYFIQNQKFNLSRPSEWHLRFKIFNFNRLSDSGATQNIILTKEQMEGLAPVTFDVTLGNIPDRFWAGNRLYYEISWDKTNSSLHPPSESSLVLERRFLDSPEYQGKGTDKTTSNATTIVIIVFVCLGIVAIIVGYIVYKRREKIAKQKQEAELLSLAKQFEQEQAQRDDDDDDQ